MHVFRILGLSLDPFKTTSGPGPARRLGGADQVMPEDSAEQQVPPEDSAEQQVPPEDSAEQEVPP